MDDLLHWTEADREQSQTSSASISPIIYRDEARSKRDSFSCLGAGTSSTLLACLLPLTGVIAIVLDDYTFSSGACHGH
jgi:hypothetical protein